MADHRSGGSGAPGGVSLLGHSCIFQLGPLCNFPGLPENPRRCWPCGNRTRSRRPARRGRPTEGGVSRAAEPKGWEVGHRIGLRMPSRWGHFQALPLPPPAPWQVLPAPPPRHEAAAQSANGRRRHHQPDTGVRRVRRAAADQAKDDRHEADEQAGKDARQDVDNSLHHHFPCKRAARASWQSPRSPACTRPRP